MEITCNIIKDLLPLYAENIANDDTKDMIEEHLKGCTSCMQKLEQMQQNTQTQILPKEIEYEFFSKMNANLTRVILNITLTVGVFLAIINLIYICMTGDIGFLEVDKIELEITPEYFQIIGDNIVYNNFDESITTYEHLNVTISGGIDLSSSNITKVELDNGKFIFYIEVYKRLFGEYPMNSYQRISPYEFYDYTETTPRIKIEDYVEAIYIATPNDDFLVYGNDVATEKFDVNYPHLVTYIFGLIAIILAIICLIIRSKSNKINLSIKVINAMSIASIILLANSMFILKFILFGWNTSDIYNYYLMLNSIPLALVVSNIVLSLYTICKNIKKQTKKYNIFAITMFIFILGILWFEMIRVFEWISYMISIEHIHLFYPILPIILGLIFVLGYYVYKNDTLKPRQVLTKSYKISQVILAINLIALQNFSLYIFSLKDGLIGESIYKGSKLFFMEHIFFADILNMTSKLIIIYAFYCIIKHKDYPMIGIILQAIAISMEKGICFHLYLENIQTMNDISYQIFTLSYIMIGLTISINKKLIENKL